MSRNVLIIVGIIVVGATGALWNMAASFDMDFSCGVK